MIYKVEYCFYIVDVFCSNVVRMLRSFYKVKQIKHVQLSATMSSDRVTSCCRRNGMTALSKFADVERCLRQLKLPAEARVLVRNVRADTSEKFLAIRRIHTTKVVVGFDISRSDLVQKSFGAHEAMAAPNTTY